MRLLYFRKTQRTCSLVCVLILFAQSAYPSYLANRTAATQSQGSGQPVSASTSGLVDPYTGDFHYSVPLLTVPGPNGESVNISAGYHAGIRVDEKASWLGLGWDYNPGEISRQVVGTPDDWNGKPVYNFSYNSITQPNEATFFFGAMYTKNINNVPTYSAMPYSSGTCTGYASFTYKKSTDYLAVDRQIPLAEWERINQAVSPNPSGTFPIRFKRYTLPYENLAYDNYMVSGPVSGMMKPYFLGQQRVHRSVPYNLTGMTVATGSSTPMQFYMENSCNNTVTSQTNTTVVNTGTNRIKAGTFIKYYTNDEINDNANLFDNSSQAGFLDYATVSGTRRPGADYDPDGIGAYEITGPDGMTYHYSLAVYAFDETDKVLEATGSSGYYTSAVLTYKPHPYASSWKLTAVTGPDYQDSNTNHVADAGDTGYWVAYNYSLWCSDYAWSSSRYNSKDDVYYPSMGCLPGNYGGPHNINYFPNSYRLKKSIAGGKSQVYYLNYIQTSTHTALFVKSIRKDEQSYDKTTGMASQPTPLLKLDRIILLRNEDLGSMLTANVPLAGADLDGRFGYAKCAAAQSDASFINATKYNNYKLSIDPKSLKSVEFVTDYSLCRKYHYNIDNTFTSTAILATINPCDYLYFNGNDVLYVTYDKTVSGNATIPHYDNSGKLTLNSLKFYDISAEKISPSMDFSYAKTSAYSNPDYDADRTDLWGYYKSDYVAQGSHYPSDTSASHIDAWSLREITSPLGGKIQVHYEPDQYEREGFSDDPGLIVSNNMTPYPAEIPSFIFPLRSMDPGFANPVYEYADYSDFTAAFSAESPANPNPRYCMTENVIPIRESCAYDYSLGYATVNYFGASTPSTDLSGCSGFCHDVDMSYACPSGVLSFDYQKEYGYGYQVFKMAYVNGGGLRVASISTAETARGETYTEHFEYRGGYCVAVPKKLVVGTYNGPSNFNLLINDKMSIEGLPSSVGYSSVNVTHTSMNGVNTGTVSYEFENRTIENPIQYVPYAGDNNNLISLTTNTLAVSSASGTSEPRCPGITVGPIGPGCTMGRSITDYGFAALLEYDNEGLKNLGKVKTVSSFPAGSASPVSTVSYLYDRGASSYIQESCAEGNSSIMFQDEIPLALATASTCVAGPYTVYCHGYDTYNISSVYKNHDCFLKFTTTTRDGIAIREEVVTRDPYTGAPLKTATYDPTQGIFFTISKPAYRNTSYAALGLKSVNESYKNQPLMTEQAQTLRFPYSNATYSGISDIANAPASIVVSESKSTFSASYPYRVYNASGTKYENSTQTKNWWRLYETYSRLLDDVTDAGNTTYNWRKLSEGTLYDLENNKIEEKGLNDRKAASKWGYQNRYKLAEISNASYNSFTFTGFEDKLLVASGVYHFGGEVTGGQYQYNDVTQVEYPSNPHNPHLHPSIFVVHPHTGTCLAKVPASTDGPAFITRNFDVGRTYTAKVWVHKVSVPDARLAIDLEGYVNPAGGGSPVALSVHRQIGKTDAANITVGDWTLMSLDIIVPPNFDLTSTHSMTAYVTNAATSGDAFFDDFAFHPKDAVMGGNVYEARTGLLKAQLDNDNFATLYNYDNAGRVISTYKEYSGGLKKVSENQYHFSKP